jgi:hypothetical protein
VLREQLADFALISGKRQIADIDLRHKRLRLLKRTRSGRS